MNAIIFDLDDTLYRERRWLLSGFAAVARHLEVAYRLDRRQSFRALLRAVRSGRRHEAFQQLCGQFDLPVELIPGLVRLVRSHKPKLTLRQDTRRVLARLRMGWRLGVLTNGPPAVQARKTDALELRRLVDAVVYAADYGTGKPEPRPFLEVAARVGAKPSRCVFVGDDPWCDIHGARQVGMRTVRLRRPGQGTRGDEIPEADAVIDTLAEVAEVASGLLSRTDSSEIDDVNDHLRACG